MFINIPCNKLMVTHCNMGTCHICNSRSPLIASHLGVCSDCITVHPTDAVALALNRHGDSREQFGLPRSPPRAPEGIRCRLCVNECRIAESGLGFCGMRENRNGRLDGVSSRLAKASWYHDPLPTNCVGDWVCAGGTGSGYPEFAHCRGAETGYRNLAVFFHACSMNCLFCQNWHFKEHTHGDRYVSVDDLVNDVDGRTSCICYFGGDPSPQLPFAIRASKAAMAKRPDSILRFCWETNGTMHPTFLDDIMALALASGGCVKFDLKALHEPLHMALTGVSNRRTLNNFRRAGRWMRKRPIPPVLIANTLLVPGYIDAGEVGRIAEFIASVDPDIPYSLLAFHPQFYMQDLPLTRRETAARCLQAAHEAGLNQVRLGNEHLLA